VNRTSKTAKRFLTILMAACLVITAACPSVARAEENSWGAASDNWVLEYMESVGFDVSLWLKEGVYADGLDKDCDAWYQTARGQQCIKNSIRFGDDIENTWGEKPYTTRFDRNFNGGGTNTGGIEAYLTDNSGSDGSGHYYDLWNWDDFLEYIRHRTNKAAGYVACAGTQCIGFVNMCWLVYVREVTPTPERLAISNLLDDGIRQSNTSYNSMDSGVAYFNYAAQHISEYSDTAEVLYTADLRDEELSAVLETLDPGDILRCGEQHMCMYVGCFGGLRWASAPEA